MKIHFRWEICRNTYHLKEIIMAETSNISWTDASFNAWLGCSHVSPGCDHCYAEVSTPARTMKIIWGPHEKRVRTSQSNWSLPLRWHNAHDKFFQKNGRKRRVFCASLSDVFDNQVEVSWRDDLWTLIKNTPQLDWLILTKRVGNVRSMLPSDWGNGYSNVWLGISVVNQDEANRDIPKLLQLPAKLRWISMEPLLDMVSLSNTWLVGPNKIEWIVVGGESGKYARKMEPEWMFAIQDICGQFSVPFFFKQWGGTDRNKGGCLIEGAEAKQWP